MNGEQWLVEAKKYRQGVKEATWAWLEHTSNWAEKDKILSATYKPFQAAINRYSDLSIRHQAIPITDPNVQPAAMLQARMAANFASVVDMRGQASDAYERVRHENNKLTATIEKYFLDEVYKVGKKVEKIRDEVLGAVESGAKAAKGLAPLAVFAGLGLLGFILFTRYKK